MCGIVGFIKTRDDGLDMRACLARMTGALSHRGPDDEGFWCDPKAAIALGHRRLSIVDLSPTGHQPMASGSGRYQLSFNGEIYNFNELREALLPLGHHFRGRSDTEVILAAIEEWGLEAAIKRFIGMFAFALWDQKALKLHLVRDRLGEKPLYYGWMGEDLLFGSELKALRAHPKWSGEVDRNALALFMRHNYIPAPYSIYEGIRKLPAGTILTLSLPIAVGSQLPNPVPYWSAQQVAEEGIANPFKGSDAEAVDHLDTLLRDAIGHQMLADVPLGAFLSGGIDSSTIVALMQAQSSRPVKTFTIGFNEDGYNEAIYAKAVANHLGTEHTELYLNANDAIAVIPKMASIYDEPFADSSQIPTFLVSQMARGHVTVCLSGDGGDELFSGYQRYELARKLWAKMGMVPSGVRRAAAGVLKGVPVGAWNALFGWTAPILLPSNVPVNFGDKVHKAANMIGVANRGEMYRSLVSHWPDPTSLILNSTEWPTVLSEVEHTKILDNFSELMMLLDTTSYLPDDILVKVDRASMAVSLENRVPFLDHRVVEFAWRLPMSMKHRGGETKWLVRQILNRYVPKELIERPKMGFGIPIDSWLRLGLRDWAESLLDESRLLAEGFFNPQPIRQKWAEHLAGTHNWHYYLWDVLMFQQWLEQQ